MRYLLQGAYPLMEATSAVVVAQKDKPVQLFSIPGGMEISWGMWEQPDADNDEEWEDGPEAA